jgi:hypothetical protein
MYRNNEEQGYLEKIPLVQKNIYLIDYGCSQRYLDENGVHRKRVKERRISGCDIYMSADAMMFYTQSRKDDLISMMYSLVYLVNDQTVWAYEDHAIDEDS